MEMVITHNIYYITIFSQGVRVYMTAVPSCQVMWLRRMCKWYLEINASQEIDVNKCKSKLHAA